MNTKEFEASENCYCNECCEKEQCSSRKRELNCAYSVRNVLRAILYAVNHIQIEGFEVTVEVTTKNGMIYPVKFAYGDKGQVKITKTLLISDSSNISICDITKDAQVIIVDTTVVVSHLTERNICVLIKLRL